MRADPKILDEDGHENQTKFTAESLANSNLWYEIQFVETRMSASIYDRERVFASEIITDVTQQTKKKNKIRSMSGMRQSKLFKITPFLINYFYF